MSLLYGILSSIYREVEPLVRIGSLFNGKELPYFRLGMGLYYMGNGGLEGIQATIGKEQPKIDSIREKILQKLNPQKEFLYAHGSTLVCIGGLNCMEALHYFGRFSLEPHLYSLGVAANCSFLLASLLALEENIRCYNEIKKHGDLEEFSIHKKAAFCGMLSNLGYIITTALSLYGSATAIALFVGIIATFFGILRVICDFLVVSV